jgi:hypothetical protein
MWSVEINQSEKGHRQVEKSRGIDVGHEVLQIFTNPIEFKVSESREDRAYWRRWRSAFLVRPFVAQSPVREFVVVRIESESKYFEAGRG